jgi:hypothetical protein
MYAHNYLMIQFIHKKYKNNTLYRLLNIQDKKIRALQMYVYHPKDAINQINLSF